MTDFRCIPETLSATVVRNILSKVRSFWDDKYCCDQIDFPHGRYHVFAVCRAGRCTKLVIQRRHRVSCDTWIIKPSDYALLPAEAFDL